MGEKRKEKQSKPFYHFCNNNPLHVWFTLAENNPENDTWNHYVSVKDNLSD